ncbi:DUF1707 SHOCT-like domain-containing protein [Nocardioides xinjiangensis]|uniref:DUF1707 SHOCT-like domain-containing protein n=1 Tax=Nocardioides xinjiangensis TaxID=2817376 RepID=UPI001B31308D|nr:DUF1707 domain-containing protein [Nocardioides sp. SYSU D00514]
MRGFRARDADRDRCVEVIEAAYADGQIGDADRELRTSRALSAETLDELETLTRDLQPPPGPAEPVRAPATSGPVRPRRPVAVLAALGTAVVVVAAGAVGLAVLSTTDDTGGQPAVEVSGEAVPVPDPAVAGDPAGFEMTAAGVRRFLRAYEQQFGTLDAWDVAFYPHRVGADVPVRGSRPRFEAWTWDGSWERTSEAQAIRPSHTGVVDLGRIGPDRLVANVRTAERTLGVQRGTFSHAVLWRHDEVGPTLNIHVGNTFGEGGYLRTTLAGDRVVARFPYDR